MLVSVCQKKVCSHACACSSDREDSDVSAGAQKIAAGGKVCLRTNCLPARKVPKEQDSNKDNHRPHRVTPVSLVVWTTIGHGHGVDGVGVEKIQVRVT